MLYRSIKYYEQWDIRQAKRKIEIAKLERLKFEEVAQEHLLRYRIAVTKSLELEAVEKSEIIEAHKNALREKVTASQIPPPVHDKQLPP